MLARCLSGLTSLQNIELESINMDVQSGSSTGMNGCYALAQEAAKLNSMRRLNLRNNNIYVQTKEEIMSLDGVKSGKMQVLLDAEEIAPVYYNQGLKFRIFRGDSDVNYSNHVNTAACFSGKGPQSSDTSPERSNAAQLVCGDITRGSVIIQGTSQVHFVDLISNEALKTKPGRIVRAECFCQAGHKGYYELNIGGNGCSDWRFGFVPLSLWPLQHDYHKNFEDTEFTPASFSFEDLNKPELQKLKEGDIISLSCDLAEKKIRIRVQQKDGTLLAASEKELKAAQHLKGLCPGFTCSPGGILSCSLGGLGEQSLSEDRKPGGFEAMGKFLPPPKVSLRELSNSCTCVGEGPLLDSLLACFGLDKSDTLYVEGNLSFVADAVSNGPTAEKVLALTLQRQRSDLQANLVVGGGGESVRSDAQQDF
jgi:hypothetical protein